MRACRRRTLAQHGKRRLAAHFGVVFDRQFTLAILPIRRFGPRLVSKGRCNSGTSLPRSAHRKADLDQALCRGLVCVDWQDHHCDFDFNQQLGLAIGAAGKPRLHLSDIASRTVEDRAIGVAHHCFGCTAGQGSGSGGAPRDGTAAAPSCVA